MYFFPPKKDLQELKAFKEPFSLTIYAPYIEEPSGVNPNRVQLKNLIKEAEYQLLAQGLNPRTTSKTLAKAKALLEDKELWTIHKESLVVFTHPQLFKYYHVPRTITAVPLINIKKGFNLKPLEAIMSQNILYFVLALSHNNVRFYKGDNFNLTEVKPPGLPVSLKQALNIDEYPKSRETHAIAPAILGKGSEAFHSQYNVRQVDKKLLLEFFRVIDHQLHKFLIGKNNPLILACVDYLAPIYKKVNSYPYLVDEIIRGNPDHKKSELIHKQAKTRLGVKA